MLLAKTKFAVLVLLLFLLSLAGCGAGQMDPASVHRLVVMPIEDGTAQKDFGDLADGITEHLTAALGTAKGVDVLAFHTGLEYKLRPRVVAEIQKTLSVDALVEGDINLIGDQLTVSAWLVDAKSGKLVWETKASGKREAAFVLTEDVALALSKWINKPLRMKKSVTAPTWQHFLFLLESIRLSHHTDTVDVNLAVYDSEKLRGDYPDYWPARAPAAHLFGRLIAMEFLTRDKAREWIKGILADIRQGPDAEPESAEAYYAEGVLKYYVDWDFAAGEAALKKAIDARPNLMYAWHALAQLYITTNRLPLAMETMEQAQKLDPLGFETTFEQGAALAANGRYDDALKTLDAAAALTKADKKIVAERGLYQFAKGDAEGARVSIAALLEGQDEMVGIQALYGAVQSKLGKPAETKRMLALLDARPGKKYAPADPMLYAIVHMGTGDLAKGFSELDIAIAARRTLALRLPGYPAFAPYQSDPRWKAVVAKLAASKPIQ
jgi:TolB-like protein